jgi:transcriptional regulator with XRE-family HTH domain
MSSGRTRECPTCRGSGRLTVPGPTPLMGEMGRRLTALLVEHNMTQDMLGKTISRSQPTISLWLSGKRKIPPEDLCKLADLFATTTDYLLGRNSANRNGHV